MAFFVLTRAGFESLVKQTGKTPDNLWVNRGVLTDAELETYRATAPSFTNFTYEIDIDDRAAISDALDMISEHHPGEPIYAEWTGC